MTKSKQKFKTTEFSQIPYEWNIAPFADVIDFQEGPGILAKDFRENGVPLIRLAGLTETANLLDGCNYLDPDMVKKRWHHFHVLAGDVLLSTSASLGRTAIVNKKAAGALVYTGIIRMRPVEKKIDNKFIFYFLQSPYFQEQVLAMGVGSVMKHFGPSHLRLMKVLLPPLPEQRAIAAVLSSFDDKIELLRSQNQTLEALAQALFKEWFVDSNFPNAQGKPYKKSGGKMVKSELGEIPEKWKIGRFTEIAEILSGGTPKTDIEEYWNGRIPFFTPKDAKDNFYVIKTEKNITEDGLKNCNSKLYPKNTIFITARGTVGKCVLSGTDMAMNQSCYALNGKEISNFFIYLLTKNHIEKIQKVATGAVFDAITVATFESMEIVIPKAQSIKHFEEIIKPIFNKILNNEGQIQNLSILRNSLLPKLISGNLKVRTLT